jgi:lipid A oxidase
MTDKPVSAASSGRLGGHRATLVGTSVWSAVRRSWLAGSSQPADRAASVLAVSAFVALAVSMVQSSNSAYNPAMVYPATSSGDDRAAAGAGAAGLPGGGRLRLGAKDTRVGAYGGTSFTHPSDVRITKPGRTDMTVRDVSWIGLPFKSPIYYGVRVQRLAPLASFGSMVDFTHAKAIAVNAQEVKFEGTRDGKAVPASGKIGDTFRHLEFSHGHNMLTWNGIYRSPAFWSKIRPYVGAGAGITLPHTEIGFRDENTRTYEYQYAGLVGQVLGGIEINLGSTSVFFEYKFSYSPYEVPLSHEPRGSWLFVDVWRQFKAWITGQAPPGGRLATKLATHHGIAGVLVNLPGR